MFKEYELFELTKQLPDDTISIGTGGGVLMVLSRRPPVYIVEFPDGKGGNLGKEMTYDITEDFMRRIK